MDQFSESIVLIRLHLDGGHSFDLLSERLLTLHGRLEERTLTLHSLPQKTRTDEIQVSPAGWVELQLSAGFT